MNNYEALTYSACDRFDRKQHRMNGMKRKNARNQLCPVLRWVDLDKPYDRAKEKQELRDLLSC